MEFNKPSVLSLDGSLADNFTQFKEEVNIYLTATETNKKPKEVQVARLKNLLGSEGLKLYKTLKDDCEIENIDYILSVLEKHCIPKRNMTMDVYKLITRKQEPQESFEHFFANLKHLIKPCCFDTQEEKLLKALIVIGINSKDLKERLLREDISLDKMIQFCKAAELASKNVQVISQPPNSEVNVFKSTELASKNGESVSQQQHSDISVVRNLHPDKSTKVTGEADTYFRRKCSRCGNIHGYKCPAYGKICSKCNKPNHFSNVCRSKLQQNVPVSKRECNNLGLLTREAKENGSHTDDYFLDNEACIDSIDAIDDVTNNRAWYKNILVEGVKIKFKLDSGADVNILPFQYLKENNLLNELRRSDVKLQSFGGFTIKPLGAIEAQIETDRKFTIAKFIIVKHVGTVPILGLETCLQLNLIKRVESMDSNIDSPSTDIEKKIIFDKNKDVFEGLGCFPDKCKIKLKADAVPMVSSARRIPLKIRDKFKVTLDSLIDRGIVMRVEEPVDWVNNVVIVEKPNGSLRVCIDPTELNKNIVRERYTIPTLNDITPNLVNKTHFSILDLKDGFYHVPLDEDSSKLCSFSTIFGTYRFLRAPFGLSCMPEIFQRLVTKYFGDINGVSVYFDDLCISSNSKEENDTILEKVFERARKYNIKFNYSKFQYCKSSVKYLGVIFSKEGMMPDPDKVETIKNLDPPKDKKSLQGLLGMVNYLRSFIPNLSEIISPLRDMLKKNVVWNWTDNHTKVLDNLKRIICSSQVLTPFEATSPIEIQCDASKDAIGFCMLQKGKPVHFGSRSLNSAEEEYAQIEKELLAICFSVSKLHNYIYGHHDVVVFTDHMPLVSIIGKPLNKIINNRIKRLKLKLVSYQLKVKYLPGKYMFVADYMSRCGIKTQEPKDELMNDFVHAIGTKQVQFAEPMLVRFQNETENDEVLKNVNNYLHNGWPQVKQLKGEIKHFYNIRNDLLIKDCLIYYGSRLVVPQTLKKVVLKSLHETHLGIIKINQQAKEFFYWPGITSDINNMVTACPVCQKYMRSKMKSPLINHDIPNIPFNKIAVDIAEFKGVKYLVIVDYFSRWLELFKMTSTGSSSVIGKLKEVFSRFGIPKVIIADNVPFGSEEMKQFSKDWNFTIATSSPYYPKSNGLAEKAVGIVKMMLEKCTEEKQDIELYLLNYRNAPLTGIGFSPSQLMNSRHMRSKIVVTENLLKPSVVPENVYETMKSNQFKQKQLYDRNARRNDESFNIDDKVWVQDTTNKRWEEGVIVEKLPQPRSYLVRIKNKGIKRRNEQFIRKRIVYENKPQLPTAQRHQENTGPQQHQRPQRFIRPPSRLDL